MKQNIYDEQLKKTNPATPIFPGLMPTDGREYPRHIAGLTRLVMILLYSYDLSKSFLKKDGDVFLTTTATFLKRLGRNQDYWD